MTSNGVNGGMFDPLMHNRITLNGGEFVLNRGAGIYVVIGSNGKIIGRNFSKTIKTGDFFSALRCRGKIYRYGQYYRCGVFCTNRIT